MDDPPIGRAPIIDWPIWNEDGSIKTTWQKWFNAIAGNIANCPGDAVQPSVNWSTNSQGPSAQGVIITAFVGALMAAKEMPGFAAIEGAMKMALMTVGRQSPVQYPRIPQSSIDTLSDESSLALARSYLRNRPVPFSPQQVLIRTQAMFPSSATLQANSFVYVTDYYHLLFWDGATFNFCGDPSNIYIVADVSPGNGWHACDGSIVNYLNANGTLTAKTLPNITTEVFLAVGSAGDGLTHIAVAPSVGTHGATNGSDFNAVTSVGADGTPASFYSKLWFRL